MRKVDLFWRSNDEWWEFQNHIPVLKETAPAEAKESYEHYLEQMSEERIRKIDCDWEETFAPHILARGKKYFEEGRVSQIIQYGNRITAHVDGSLICVGKGNPDWNCSAPHGAGRLMSRKEAFKRLNLEEYRKEMEGIYTTCVDRTTLDEAPMAYKGMDEIISHIGPTVDIVERITPVYNFKAAE